MIRPYRDEDAQFLAPLHTAVFPDDPLSIPAFRSYAASSLAYGGRAWVIEQDAPFGYALTVPVPGLPHIADLKGLIAPTRQRHGFGRLLLRRVLSDLQSTAVRQVSHQVHTMDSPAAQFLCKNGFTVEHEEWLMIHPDLHHLPQPRGKDGAAISTLPRSDAVKQFHRLFSGSFSGHPWHQPYDQHEIDTALGKAKDIIFLTLDSQPIGFAWLHLEAGGLATIEPVGLLPTYQQQGYGRFLLLSALYQCVRRGASRAQIGAWRTNKPAIHLYQSLGFTRQQTITFLAYELTL